MQVGVGHRLPGGSTIVETEVDAIEPAERAYPVIEDALARYSHQRRKGFKDKH